MRAVNKSVDYIDPIPAKARLNYGNPDGSLKADLLNRDLTVKHAARAASARGDEQILDHFNELDEDERRRLLTAAVARVGSDR